MTSEKLIEENELLKKELESKEERIQELENEIALLINQR